MSKEKVYISIDVECDGPTPGRYSMIEIGAVIVEEGLTRTFFANLAPISDEFNETALKISHRTREETLQFEDAKTVMQRLANWVSKETDGKKAVFVDDNGFDWAFVNYYLWQFTDDNVFGHNDFNLNSFVKGIYNDPDMSVKTLHKRDLLHNALEDAKDNADVMLRLKANDWKKIPKP